jgi:tetratricopeptide (TPR) repeat protein
MKQTGDITCAQCGEITHYTMTADVQRRLVGLAEVNTVVLQIECMSCAGAILVVPETLETVEFSGTGRRTWMIFQDDLWSEDHNRAITATLDNAEQSMNSDLRRAADLVSLALNRRKFDVRGLFLSSLVQMRQGNWSEAVDPLRTALRFAPDHVELWNNLGTCYLALERPDAAEHCFTSGRSIEPGNPKMLLGLANAALLRDNLTLARQHLRMALQIDPNYSPAKKLLNSLPRG